MKSGSRRLRGFRNPHGCRLKRLVGGRPYRPHVGELFYVREPYSESYIRFYTEPRLTVYMPAEAPAEYPNSHFWRVQEVLRRGGYAADDVDTDKEFRERELTRRPRWLRAVGKVLFRAQLLNICVFLATFLYFGGLAARSEGGKYYFRAKGKREWEVPRRVWTYSYVHQRAVWVLFPFGVLGFIVAEIPLSRTRPEGRHRSLAYGPPR